MHRRRLSDTNDGLDLICDLCRKPLSNHSVVRGCCEDSQGNRTNTRGRYKGRTFEWIKPKDGKWLAVLDFKVIVLKSLSHLIILTRNNAL